MVTKEFIKKYQSFLASEYKKKSSKLTKEDIEDLVQDTFEKVTLYQDYYTNEFDTQKKIPENARMKAWLKLLCVDVYGKYQRGSLVIDEMVKDYTEEDKLFDSNDYFYTANKEEVDAYINMLPKSQSTVVYMKLVLGYSHEEVSKNLFISTIAAQSTFKRGMDNLKKLVNSDNPEKEVLQETKILKPHGDRPFAGDWAWRYGESEEQRNSKVYIYTDADIEVYKQLENTHYKLKVKNYELKTK